MSSTEATEINNLYDRLQAAHEERDRYKLALEEIKELTKHYKIINTEIIELVIKESLE